MVANILSLKWDHHGETMLKGFTTLRKTEAYFDATIACSGRFYRVHRFVLSTCSEYLEHMFEEANLCSPVTHPVIVLQDIKPEYLEALLNYMYIGEVSVPQADIPGLLKTAEYLNIKGLNAQGDSLSINLEEGTQGKKRHRSAPTRQDKFRKRSESSSSVNTSMDPPHDSENSTITKQSSYVSITSSNQEMTPSVLEFEDLESRIERDQITIQNENSYLEITPGIYIDTAPELPVHARISKSIRQRPTENHTYNNQGLSTVECLTDNTLLRTVAINGHNNWLQSILVSESQSQQHQSSTANIEPVESENLYSSIRSIRPLINTNASFPDKSNKTFTMERPFVCPICDQSFGHKIVKTLHMFRYHNEAPPTMESISDSDALLSDL